ncbi:expressed unknown protein [Seminavis robusta]|uniref:Cytochrome b5 heme-binding domain-containing protein n=1 Tax=Seminavis robusta TaxID=568900 RepID=A0A9N8EH24_9STRA|nr:expressed unknown protein [Seminavis robusta]|eukprot:Sro983_g227860.1 n/a (113) ;mRNA; r:39004-39342
MSRPATTTITLEECDKHASEGDFWVVVETYVLDLSSFLQHHPGRARKIIQKRKELGCDITPNFLNHFGHTVRTFRQACQEFDRTQEPVSFDFQETANNKNAPVVILGKIGSG